MSKKVSPAFAKLKKIFGSHPLSVLHLPELSLLMFSVCAVSGILLLPFYKLSSPYRSVLEITQNPALAFIKNIHRYSSDAFFIFAMLHLAEVFARGRVKPRIVWLTGIILLVLAFTEGVTGFLLVWDGKAKVLGMSLARMLDSLPLFKTYISAFLLEGDTKFLAGLFRVCLVAHLMLSVFFILFTIAHTWKLQRTSFFPPLPLTLLSLALLFTVSLFPSSLDMDASLMLFPEKISADIPYFFTVPLEIAFGEIFTLSLTLALFLALSLISLFKRMEKARVSEKLCTGCMQCVFDCPYDAVRVEEGKAKATSSCTFCGICQGACPENAVLAPLSVKLMSDGKTKKLKAVCENFCGKVSLTDADTILAKCIGDLNPKHIEIFEQKYDEILIFVCEKCAFRLGNAWTKARFEGKRRPVFKKDARRKVKLVFEKTGTSAKLVSILTLLSVFFAIPLLSNAKLRVLPHKGAQVFLSINHKTAPAEFFEFQGELAHMKGVKIALGRSPVKLFVGKREIEIKPSGLRGEGWVRYFGKFKITESTKIRAVEVSTGKVLFEVEIKPEKKVYYVRFREGKLSVISQ